MAGHGKRRKGGHDDHGEHVDERWLLTYSDLITLLMALFMVLFSISSVNKSKFESLQHALQDAFSGRILPGGKSIKEAGGTDNVVNPSPAAPQSSVQPYVGGNAEESAKGGATQASAAAAKEQQDFTRLKAQLDRYVRAQGLQGRVSTRVTSAGLAIRVLTDDLLFDSGSAVPRPGSQNLLGEVARLLQARVADHMVVVQGNTDTQPINSAEFPDNLALSSARANAIWRVFAGDGVDPRRLMAAGVGQYHPIAPNGSAGGRSLNRRVEILVPKASADGALTAGTSSSPSDSASIPSIRPSFAPKSSP